MNLKNAGIESIPLFIYRDLDVSMILKKKQNHFLILHPARIMKYTSSEMIKFHQPRGVDLCLVQFYVFHIVEEAKWLEAKKIRLCPWANKPTVVI